MIKRTVPRLFFILLAVVVLSLPAWSVPLMINVQGRLTDPATGAPKIPSVGSPVFFKIFRGGTENDYTSGTMLLSKNLWVGTSIIIDDNGIFNVNLDLTGISDEFLEAGADPYYLQLRFGTMEPLHVLLPRQRLVSVPFAITAKNYKGGSIEVTGDPAVKGSVAGTTTTFGELGRKITGIFFTDVTTVGVYGKAQGDREVAVMGENYGPGMLIFSKIYYGRGVAGYGKVGVHGYGVTVGGSFESTDTEGIGVYGGGPLKGVFGESKGGGIGVHGKGVSGPGGKFESSSGPALEIGPGWLKMPIATATWNSILNAPTINSNAGIIDFNGATAPAGFWLMVNCDRVRSNNAVVFLQSVWGVSEPKVKDINYPTTQAFKVWCENGDDIAFLVINP